MELPEPIRLAGVAAHEVLLVASVTTPANPLSPLTLTVEVTAEPALPVALDGLTLIVKS